ncbi:exocyst complex component sec10 [Micractinium conductrix]|uniref:Exocyst complex component sec10 n=1 Tax=Micractinium conductrix TaxID=554055 RepID=A0A2P6VET6_9CHLO|nr:exocyst complex component sec10 [Micractinium conductrix]|eukprot:PSC72605.1 exocyst complex component sec10 [Micractinium conductrix]
MAAEHGRHRAKGSTADRAGLLLEDVTAGGTAALIAKVAGELGAPAGSRQLGAAPASVSALLERFERCDKELAKLQQQVDLRAERLRREVGAEEAGYRARVAAMEAEWAGVRRGFGELEARMTGVTQAATKIGNRLQNADACRQRALEAADQIGCLHDFAHASDPSDLPPLFHDDSRLAEAAALTSRLLAVAQELMRARERVSVAEPRPRVGGAAPEPGSLEAAAEQLELYRNVLDNRLVARFDAALGRQDLRAMAECARTMAEFSRGEAILVQRYISTRPMFTNLKELQATAASQAAAAAAAAALAVGTPDSEEALEAEAAADAAALRGLANLYKHLLGTLRDEAVVIEQVFPSPHRALGQYIQRVFEQKVQAAVDAALRPPPAGAGHALLHGRLRTMAEVYKRTRALADDLQELCGGEDGGAAAGVNVGELADMVCADALGAYLGMELRWLSLQYEAAAAARGAGAGLSLEAVQGMLATNEEAVERCLLLSPPAALASSLRQLFHASTRQQANTGCLLEQVATHLVLGLNAALEGCTKALLQPFRPQPLLDEEAAAAAAAAAAAVAAAASSGGAAAAAAAALQQQQQQQQQALAHRTFSRRTLLQAAQVAMGASLGRLLQAVTTVGSIVSQLQAHYQRVVAPQLASAAGGPAEARACVSGVAALVRAVDERVVGALQRCLALLAAQADATLQAEQRRDDFCPAEAASPTLEEPTAACSLACALLQAAVEAAAQHLHGPNLASFLAELGRRLCLLLDAHLQRFAFSPLGALRWKRDLTEYASLAARLRAPATTAHLEEMASRLSLLIVAPDSLLPLVDGQLRMSHRAAAAYVALREDFGSARVGGATMAQLFGGD